MPLPRISLGETLAVAALFCGLLAALRFAGEISAALIGLLAGLMVLYAIVAAIFDRGSARASAGGFAIGALLYGALFVAAGVRQESDLLGFQTYGGSFLSGGNLHGELDFVSAELPTTRLLEPLYNAVMFEEWIQTDTGETMRISRGSGGMLYDPRGRAFNVQEPAIPDSWSRRATSPEASSFLAIGHFGWALIFGYAGSLFGRVAYARGRRAPGERRVSALRVPDATPDPETNAGS